MCRKPFEGQRVRPSEGSCRSPRRKKVTGKPKPTVTEAERAAAMVKMILRQAAKRVPGLKAPHSTTSKRIRGHRTVPKAFIRSMIGAWYDLEELQTMSAFHPEEAQTA